MKKLPGEHFYRTPYWGNQKFLVGEWMERDLSDARTNTIWANIEGFCYQAGYHIFTKLDDAMKYAFAMGEPFSRIVEVKYEKAHTVGVQRFWINNETLISADTIVADKLMVTMEVNEELCNDSTTLLAGSI